MTNQAFDNFTLGLSLEVILTPFPQNLVRFYHLSEYDWNAVTMEYNSVKDNLENRLISEEEFYRHQTFSSF